MEPESSVKNLPKSQGPFSASGALKSKSKLADGALEQAIDHYIKESKQYDLTKYYTEGFYLDVRDDFSWCTAYIKAVNKENGYIDVHFDNWAEKYDEECNGNSESKVLPLRYASEGYTGQKKSTLRPYDARLTKKEYIMEKMSKFSASKFLCQDQEEIQEMYQFICGELYLYIDSALTCEEKEVKKDVEGIIEIINGFIEMLQVWLSVAPDYIEYYPMMQKYPKLYLVCPQAAILNLYKSFQPSLELMFHDSPRSVEFMKTASYKLETESTICKPLTRNIHSIRLYFMEILINNKCIERLIEWINISNKSKAPDLRIILSILTSLAPTYNNVQIKHEIDECFKLAICDYLYEEETGIVSKIKCLPDSQLKDIKQEEFVKVLKDFYNCNKTTVPREAYISRVQFDILLMFLQSPYIDKKLTAMNEIKKMFEKKSRSRDTASNKVIAKFLAESDMLNYIYQEAKHPELITRSADLIIILNDHNLLEVETLQMIWETCINEHKHEAVTEATLNVISTVARHLDKDMVKIFLDNIQSLPLQMLAENIGIIKEFYMNFYSNLKSICGRSRAEKEMAEAANLKILWEAVQDESEVNSKHKFATLDALIELMILFDLTNTSEFFISAVEYLREGKSSVKCMIMIEKILESLSRRGYPSIIKKEDLIALAIQSAEVYINNARENSPMEGGKIEDMIFSGGLSHKDTINKYFGFITNLLTNFEGHNKLTNDHIDYMFKVFVKESISKVERSSFYNFFTFDEFDTSFTSKKNIASSRNREYLFNNILCKELNSTNTGTCEFKCFETNFFNVNCSKKNLKRQSNEQVFRTIKMGLEGLDLVWDFSIFSENDQIRNQCNNFLADLYLYYEKESCKKRGENNSTFFHSWIEKIMTIDEQNNQGIANILDLLFHFVKRYDGDHMDDEYFEKMDTDFTVEFQDHPPNTPKKKIFKINKEMTLGAIRKRIGDFYKIIPSEILIISGKSYLTECCMLDKLSAYRDCRSICIRRRTREERELELPRYLAGANLNVMQQVIEKGLQSDNHDLRCKSLQFLEYIPPNNERREKMIKCKKISKGVTQSDWFRFMYCDGYDKQGLYYGLKVMKSILTPFEPMYSKADRTKFSQEISFFQAKFLEYDGFPLLCETLKELNVESALKDVVWLSIFQMITEILMKLLDDIDFVNASLKNKKSKFPKAITKLILSMTQILSTVSESISLSRDLRENLLTPEEVKTMSEEKIKNTIEEYELFENNFCSNCIDLLSCCFSIAPDDFGTFYESPFIEKEGIVNLLTFYPNKRAMKKVADSLYNMCEKFRGDDRVLQNPAYFLIALLQKDMEIVHRSPDVIYTEYFNLWDKVIRLVSIEESRQCLNSVEVATSLYSIIHKRKLIEDDYQQDTVLSGCLRLLETLDEYFHEDLKAGLPNIFKDKFLYFLLSDALFDRKKVEDDKDSEMRGQSDTSLRMLSHDDLSYPLCKHQETRKYAFRLLNRLFGERKMPQIAAFIENYIRDGSWRTNKRDKWFLHPSKLSQRKTHVGLVNLGCTCYMNSMMQQLFMSPHFRTFICNVQDNKRNEVPLEDNVLYQAKYLFANLIKSKMPVFNPTALFNSVKDMTGQALPTNEQRDVDEFFSMFLDQAEKNFIGTKGEQDLKKIFGGTFAQQLICIGCPHRSSREEPYLTMSLEIKNKANIKEALDLFIKGDMLEGDNAYYCDRCDKKVDTLKRCCVKKLPNFLILGLKRFEFDLETFTRCKLNSRFEFYEDLDMRDYCQETLAKKELIKKMNDDNLTYEMLDDAQKAIYDYKLPDQYYQYKLKGVVVHYGTVDGGHYYSYIKERGTSKWYEFNDTSVRDYDPADLADDTFGGTFKHARRSDRSGRVYTESERLHNAYVLIYEREEYLDSNKVVDLVESGQQDFRELVNSCTIPLERLKIEDDILQELTSSYDKTWIANKMFDDSFIDTVLQMCKSSSMQLKLANDRSYSQTMELDESPDELEKLKFTTLFFLGVIIRSESRLQFADRILMPLIKIASKSLNYSRWLISCFTKKYCIDEFFTSNWSSEACRLVNSLFIAAFRRAHIEEVEHVLEYGQAMTKYKSGSPEDGVQFLKDSHADSEYKIPLTSSCVYNFMLVLCRKIDDGELSGTLSSFLFFGILNEIANVHQEYRRIMIDFKVHVICVKYAFGASYALQEIAPGVEFTEEDLSIEQNLEAMSEENLGKYQSFKLSKFEKLTLPGLAKDIDPFLYTFKLLSKLVRSCQYFSESQPSYIESPFRMENEEPLGYVLPEDVENLVSPNESVIKYLFLTKCAIKPLRNELAKFYGHLLFNDEKSIIFSKTLIAALNEMEYFEIEYFERILLSVIMLPDKYIKERVFECFKLFIKIIINNDNSYAYTNNFISMLIKFAKKDKNFRAFFFNHEIVDKVNTWISRNKVPSISHFGRRRGIFKDQKKNNKYTEETIRADMSLIKELNNKMLNELLKMHDNTETWEDPDPESEDDIFEEELEVDSKIDFQDTRTYEWHSATVKSNLGNIIKIVKDVGDEMEVDGRHEAVEELRLNKDVTELAPYNSKTSSARASVLILYSKAYEA